MTVMPWKTEYETGVEEIDLQHRYFLALINRQSEEQAGSTDDRYRHHQLHINLIDQLTWRGQDGYQGLIDFLVSWFVHHTVGEDRLIGEYVRQSGPG